MMQRQNYSLLLLLVASVILSLPYIPYYSRISCDTETYRYVSLVMMKGGVPYQDVFDHKPPLIYFINYTGLFLGGWPQWIAGALLAMIATFLFYRLGRRYRLPYPCLPPLLFNLMLHDIFICGVGGITREYTSLLLVIFFCTMMGTHRWRYYLMGFLAAFTFFLQQEEIFALLPFLIYGSFRKENNVSPRHRILGLAVGGLSVATPIVLYFALHHALEPFWRDAFGFNFGVYTSTFKDSFGDHLRRAKRVLDKGNYEVPALVVMTLGIASLMFRGGNKRLMLAALVTVPLSIIPAFMGGRGGMGDFYDYYLPLSASLSILLFVVFAFTEEPFLQAKKAQGIFGILVCTSLSYTALQHLTHMTPQKKHPVVASPELKYLRQHPPGDYQLYEFGDHEYVYAYNEFRILAPSRWVYHHLWALFDNWDKDKSILHGIEQDLVRHRTTYVIDCTGNPALQFKEPVIGLWRAFLDQYYQQVPLQDPSGVTLWKWKEAP
ncbi:MAG: hypothetical protein J0H74_02620 [Chitinophagaceae bacterium]|nr:hypothetical protein [Chitinophagaceae bacterium]